MEHDPREYQNIYESLELPENTRRLQGNIFISLDVMEETMQQLETAGQQRFFDTHRIPPLHQEPRDVAPGPTATIGPAIQNVSCFTGHPCVKSSV